MVAYSTEEVFAPEFLQDSIKALKERDINCVEYCPWFRAIITANGEDVLDVTLFTTEVVSFILSSQQPKQPRLIRN
jgi:hypothetical protein